MFGATYSYIIYSHTRHGNNWMSSATHFLWCLHLTHDMWHVTNDTYSGMNILSKFQLPSSSSLGLRVFLILKLVSLLLSEMTILLVLNLTEILRSLWTKCFSISPINNKEIFNYFNIFWLLIFISNGANKVLFLLRPVYLFIDQKILNTTL